MRAVCAPSAACPALVPTYCIVEVMLAVAPCLPPGPRVWPDRKTARQAPRYPNLPNIPLSHRSSTASRRLNAATFGCWAPSGQVCKPQFWQRVCPPATSCGVAVLPHRAHDSALENIDGSLCLPQTLQWKTSPCGPLPILWILGLPQWAHELTAGVATVTIFGRAGARKSPA